MIVKGLTLAQFRNYEKLQLSDLGRLVVFCGPNAVGKTNILEGIGLLCTTSSFRRAQIGQLIRQGNDFARLSCDLTDGNRSITTELVLEPGKKRFRVNGKTKPAADVRGLLPAVTFTPDDLEIAKKSSSVKRDTLDALGVQLSRSYAVVHRDYERALRYKNRLLKEEAQPALIDAINETLVAVAAQLYCFRRALYERIVPQVGEYYRSIALSGEQFGAAYLPSWQRTAQRFPKLSPVFDVGDDAGGAATRDVVRETLWQALEAFGPEEIRSRRAFVGPHSDQISFMLDGGDASQFASQGQQRSIVLAWKLAEVQMVRQMLGAEPVLLLDDVMSELDESRRDLLVQAVGTEVQTFVTATDLSPFNAQLLESAQVINLPL